MTATWTEKRYCGMAADLGGDNPWTNPTNYQGPPDEQAARNSAATSNALAAIGFGFHVFDDATMIQIKAHLSREKGGGGTTFDNTVQLLKAGTPIGNNEAHAATPWPADWETESYDGGVGADPLWGVGGSMTPADYRHGAFGLQLSVDNVTAEARADAVQIELEYTTPRVWLGPHLRASPTKRWLG